MSTKDEKGEGNMKKGGRSLENLGETRKEKFGKWGALGKHWSIRRLQSMSPSPTRLLCLSPPPPSSFLCFSSAPHEGGHLSVASEGPVHPLCVERSSSHSYPLPMPSHLRR